MLLRIRDFVLGTTVVLSLGLVINAQAQTLVVRGPEITGVQGDQIKVSVTLSDSVPAQIRYWTDAEVRERNSSNNPAKRIHEFLLPTQSLQNYVIVVNPGATEQKSADFSTRPYQALQTELSKARIHNPQIASGNVLSFEVDAVNATHVDVSWEDGGAVKSETRTLTTGNNKIGSIVLPAPGPQENNARVVRVMFLARSGSRELHRITEPLATTRPPVLAPAPRFGQLDVTRATRSVTFATIFQGVTGEDVHYELTLSQGQFEMKKAGTCDKDACRITVDSLRPSTTYNYSLTARAAPLGASAEFFQMGRQNKFVTEDLPKITNGPRIEFTPQGIDLVVTTDDSTISQLTYRAQGKPTAVTQDPSKAQTEHRYPITEALRFTRNSSGKLETLMSIVLTEPGSTTPLHRLNLTLAGNLAVPTPEQGETFTSYANTRLKNLAVKYGPVLMGLLGIPVP
jgi:hypothetical protein